MNNPHQVDRPEIIEILDNFGKQVCEPKKEYLSYLTAASSVEGQLKDTTLYILAPEISYEYRAINVEVINLSDLKIRFFTLATKQSEHYDISVAGSLVKYQNKLNDIQNLGLFKAALEYLINQILLKREYKGSPIIQKIIPGQARVAVLQNGRQINAGWIRFEGDEVIYYTGQGLREMWKPNMTVEEKEKARILKLKSEGELIQDGLIAKNKITDFKDIL